MGSGCSSPLRRLGGRRGAKQAQRDSISEIIGDKDNPEQLTIAAKIKAEQRRKESNLSNDQRCKLQLENEITIQSESMVDDHEITIQSEANDDQPSSASCYTTDAAGKTVAAAENGGQMTLTAGAGGSDQGIPDQQQQQQQQQQPARGMTSITTTTTTTTTGPSGSAAAAARLMGLTGAVSPALSPAPSMCQSPAPNSSYAGYPKIFTIKENHRHVIAIYPDKNTLAVWDIFEQQTVRVINDIDHPRDLRMVDQKRAVILCNRELRVYDLETGTLMTKLKGVMNQKMPYFEIFKQDYVIALARNRMYVNMLNINTGELETTFKVGEDRFLNSLLVSAEGGICVCGDETQKPFPLLVWNLNERRLMYDLRLDRHEFITRMSAISDDGHFVVSVCRQLGNETNDSLTSSTSSSLTPNAAQQAHKTSSPNFIVIYDLNSGTLFKKLQPGLDTCGVAISLSTNKSGKLINSITDSSILVWDLTTGSKKHTLNGHSAPVDTIKVQNNRLFSMDSTCKDQSLRIWDMEEGYCIAVFNPDKPISCCQMSIRGDALVCGFANEFKLNTLSLNEKNDETADDDVVSKRRKSSKSLYNTDEPPSRKASS